MSQAGRLDKRIRFRRATLVDDGLRNVETWADNGDAVWAEVKAISDGERWRAGEVAAAATSRFVVRWSSFTSALTPKDQIVSGGATYEIFGIKELDRGRQRFLELTAGRRVDLAAAAEEGTALSLEGDVSGDLTLEGDLSGTLTL